VIRGCIPKKLFVYASHYTEDFEDAAGYGWTIPTPHFDWNVLVANKNKEIARLEGLYRQNVKAAGVEIIMDRAVFEDAHTIRLVKENRPRHGETHPHRHGRAALARYGGRARRGTLHHLQRSVLSGEISQRIVIAGGGYIAVEFAHIFHGLGAEVTLLYRGPKILRGFDEDMRDALTDSMHARGIRVVVDRVLKRIDKRGGEVFRVHRQGRNARDRRRDARHRPRAQHRGMGLEQDRSSNSASADGSRSTNIPARISSISTPSAT
jgi:glutathione reductase (NADPH)